MAMTPEHDDTHADPVVAHAAGELRARPTDPRWLDITTAIVTSIQLAARRTWPLDASYPAAGTARDGDTLNISDQVVKTALHRILAGYHGAYLTRVDLTVDEHRCTGAHLTVTGLYGDVLPDTGTLLAQLAADTLTEVLGAPIDPGHITVHVDDLDTEP